MMFPDSQRRGPSRLKSLLPYVVLLLVLAVSGCGGGGGEPSALAEDAVHATIFTETAETLPLGTTGNTVPLSRTGGFVRIQLRVATPGIQGQGGGIPVELAEPPRLLLSNVVHKWMEGAMTRVPNPAGSWEFFTGTIDESNSPASSLYSAIVTVKTRDGAILIKPVANVFFEHS